jgi:8-oxo-dGTP pyrophosphatase MutT (NUDIX family)
MKSLPRVTIAFVLKDNKVLLGMKKRGFGEGKWNGSGGKAQEGEETEAVMKREIKEEFNIIPTKFEKVAEITFVEPSIPGEGIWVAHVFLIKKWTGKITESEEMKPRWFFINKVPYEKMWTSDALWLPRVLKGEKFKAKFIYGNKEKIKEQEITPVSHFS